MTRRRVPSIHAIHGDRTEECESTIISRGSIHPTRNRKQLFNAQRVCIDGSLRNPRRKRRSIHRPHACSTMSTSRLRPSACNAFAWRLFAILVHVNRRSSAFHSSIATFDGLPILLVFSEGWTTAIRRGRSPPHNSRRAVATRTGCFLGRGGVDVT